MAVTLPSSLDPLSFRRAGLRVTPPRLAVLAAVPEGDHFAVEEIAISAGGHGSVSTEAVYDVLRALTICRADLDQPRPRKESP